MTETISDQPKGGMLKVVLGVVVIAVVIAGAYYFFAKPTASVASNVVDASKYQAVFLSNGQVYFGKVTNESADYVALSDVYYMILKRPLQNQQKEGDENQPQEQPKPEYSLVKLGKEMHGPTSMSINRDQILFIENLADDSKVVSAIKNGGNK